MAAFPEDSDETGERSSATSTGSSLYETDHGRSLSGSESESESTSMSSSHPNDRNRRPEDAHPLIESGCVREFAAHVLGPPNNATDSESETSPEINQLASSDARQAVERIQELPAYERTTALVEKHGGGRPTASQQTLAVHVTLDCAAWEIVAFEVAYPTVEVAYPLFARSIDHDTSPVTAIIDPGPRETDPNAITAFEITTERVIPTKLALDKRIPELENDTGEQSSTQVGYQIAIDWFVS